MSDSQEKEYDKRKTDREFRERFSHLESKFDIFTLKIDNVLEYNKRQDKMMEDIHKVLHGNGEPAKGMVVQFARMEATIKYIIGTLKTHWKLIIAILFLIAGIALKIFAF